MIEKDRLIIGLTGSFGSGCTTLGCILGNLGFKVFQISLLLEEEAKRQGYDLSKLKKKEKRNLLQNIGNEKRRSGDFGILIKESIQLIEQQEEKELRGGKKEEDVKRPIVIESIKNPGEITELKKYSNAYIIAIDVSFEERCKRILEKTYEGDLNQFKEDDKRDRDEGLEYGQKVQKCVDLADIIIDNEDNFNNSPKKRLDFEQKIIKSYVKLLKEPAIRPPTEPEIWMNNAYSISLQSKCIKRKVGAIILKEGYAVASGYNDVPSRTVPCLEEYKECYRDFVRKKYRYCPVCGGDVDSDFRCKNEDCEGYRHNFGKLLDKCRALHAEERAILQASSLGGISLKGGVMYCTTYPCSLCANKLIEVGIHEVTYVEPYPEEDDKKVFCDNEDRIKIKKFEGVKAQAFHKLFKASK